MTSKSNAVNSRSSFLRQLNVIVTST